MTTTSTVADLVREHLSVADMTHSALLEAVRRQRPTITRASLHATLHRMRSKQELVCQPATRARMLRLTNAAHPPSPVHLTLAGPVAVLAQQVEQGVVFAGIWPVVVVLRDTAPDTFPDDTTAGREQSFLAYWRERGLFANGWPLRIAPNIEITT